MGYGYQSSPFGGFGATFGGGPDPFARMPGGRLGGGPMMPGGFSPQPIGGANVGGLPSVPTGGKGFGSAFAGGIKRAAGGFGDWLMDGDNLLGLAQVGTGVYGAYKAGKAQDRQFEAEREDREYERDEREEEKQRRATADPLRAMLLARLMQSRGGQ